MNITCNKCQSSVPETALVCPVCGHDFAPAPPPAAAGGVSPFGPAGFGVPRAPGAPTPASRGGESDGLIAVVLACLGLVFCVPLALPGLFLGLRARARAAELGRSTAAGTAAMVISVIACLVWAFAFIFYQRLFFPAHRAE